MSPKFYIASILLIALIGAVLAGIFIWTLNTLFQVVIPFTFKTWLASLLFLLTLRFFLTKGQPSHIYDDYGFDEEEDEDEEDDEEDEEDEDDFEPPPRRTRGRGIRRIK